MIKKNISFYLFLLLIIMNNYSHATLLKNELKLFGHPSLTKNTIKLTSEQKKYLSKKDIIRVGITLPDYPPYDITIDGQSEYYEGVSADYLNLVSDMLNTKIHLYKYKNRVEAIEAVKRNEIDVLTTSNQYEKFSGLALSIPYIEDIPVLYTSPKLQFNEAPKIISISYDYLPVNMISKNFPHSKIIIFKSKKEAIASAIFGNSDGVIVDLYSANYLINNSFSKRLKIKSILKFESNGVSFAFNQDNYILKEIFNLTLKNIPISEKWFIKKRWNSADIIPPDGYSYVIFSEDELKWLSKNKELVIGLNQFNAPNSYLDEYRNFQGYIPDLLEVYKIHSDISIKIMPFKNSTEIKNAINSGKIQLGVISPTNDLNKNFIFSKNIKSAEYAIVKSNKYNIKQSQEKLNIIISNNDAYQIKIFKKLFPNSEFKLVENYVDAMLYISKPDSNYITIVPIDVADYYINRYFSEELIIYRVLNDIPQTLLSFAAKQDNLEAVSIVNKILFSIPPDGKQSIENRWRIHSDPGQQTWHDYKYTIYTITGSTTIILIGLLLWVLNIKSKTKQIIDTKRKLNQQLQFIQAVVDSIPHPIYVRNTDKLLILCNNAYEKVFSEQKFRILNKTTLDGKNRVKEVDEVDSEYSYAIKSGISIHKDRQLHIDGVAIDVYHWIVPFSDTAGKISGIVGGWIDISDRVKLLSELEAAKDLADKASKAKTHFLATMSHEIRTPMNAIIGLLELSLAESKFNIKDLSSIKLAYEAANDLQSLLGDILDIAKIESGELALNSKNINLENNLQSILLKFQILATQKKLYLTLDYDRNLPKFVFLDPISLRQILTNLIGNSIKFTERGGVKIRVKKNKNKLNQDYINFEVIDTGTGIPIDEQDKIFSPFVQAYHGNHGKGGTGLGLAIAKSLCNLMGGEIFINYSNKSGTRIDFNLPLVFSNEHNLTLYNYDLENNQSLKSPSINILIVDDNSTNRLLLSKQLNHLGHDVTVSKDGIEALNLYTKNKYDLIITDCNMPLLDGYGLAKRIREIEDHNKLKSIIIFGNTANAQADVKKLCLESGMNDCLFKPINLNDLKSKILEYFNINNLNTDTVETLNLVDYKYPNISEKLIDLCSGKLDFILDFIKEIINSNTQDIILLKNVIYNHNLSKAKEIAHRIKGSSKILDINEITKYCELIESSTNILEVQSYYLKLEDETKLLEEKLNQLSIEYIRDLST